VYAFSVWIATLRRDILPPQGIPSNIYKPDSYTRKRGGPGRIELWHSSSNVERSRGRRHKAKYKAEETITVERMKGTERREKTRWNKEEKRVKCYF
jgi:hypothetical protein